VNFGPYKPTEFYSSKDKVKFAQTFVKLVESGFSPSKFPAWFYRQLSNTFGHIAHFDQNGFYAAQFGSKRQQLEFLRNAASYQCYGQPEFTFSDVERDLKRWVNESGLIAKLEQEIASEREAYERRLLAELKDKYEPKGGVT
jgi:hypothetical protein